MSAESGLDAMARIDRGLEQARRQLDDVLADAEHAERWRAEIKRRRLETFKALAELRLDLALDEAGAVRQDEHEREAASLLARHEEFVDGLRRRLREAADAIEALERARAELADAHDEAVEAYERRVAEVEAELSDDPAHQERVDAAEAAAATAERAARKLELARADQAEKGRPYEDDPLFSYLWAQRFQTPGYEGGGLFRMLDGWVARLCGYDRARLNYAKLIELPKRLAEHAERVGEAQEAAIEALEASEAEALAAGGADELKAKADALPLEIRKTDKEIADAEARHLALAAELDTAVSGNSGPAAEARKQLQEALEATSFPDLRVLASETTTLEDDRLVDELVRLRAEELEGELAAERRADAPAKRRRGLERLERFRASFKQAGYDRGDVLIRSSVLDDVLNDLATGRMDVESGVSALRRTLRRRRPRTYPGFGGAGRRSTLGLPEALEDVAWEVLRAAGRSGGAWGGRGRARRSRGTRPSLPRPRGGGGFKTGGGF